MKNKKNENKLHRTYYTNGIREIRIADNDMIPEGWYKGRVKSTITTLGKVRITNGVIEKFINKEDEIPKGWKVGRLPKFKSICGQLGKNNTNSLWINNGKVEMKLNSAVVPEGFVKGRLPMKEEQKTKCSKSHLGKKHTEEARKKISLHSNNNREKAYKTIEEKYGSRKNYFQQIVSKVDKTKRINHTFNTSKPENNYYKQLCEKYTKSNVYRNYKSTSYPYRCDFYIKTKNLYIEINLHWTHGQHPFNQNNDEDIHTLEQWKEKAKTSQFYKQAIETWTTRDVEKLNCLRKNKLKFKIIYPNEIIEK